MDITPDIDSHHMNPQISLMKVITAELALILFIWLAFTGMPSSAADDDPVLRAGAATSNITPSLGALRVGSFAPYPSVHVHDELHARCLVLDDGVAEFR